MGNAGFCVTGVHECTEFGDLQFCIESGNLLALENLTKKSPLHFDKDVIGVLTPLFHTLTPPLEMARAPIT